MFDVPTRGRLVSVSLIDLIFINKSDNIICHGTLPKIADHEGTLVSFNIKSQKQKTKTRIIYDFKNADVEGLIKYIKDFDFQNTVFNLPTVDQTEMYTQILQTAFAKFVPCKNVIVRPNDQSWCNSFTRLLIRKKNRNYQFYKNVSLTIKIS